MDFQKIDTSDISHNIIKRLKGLGLDGIKIKTPIYGPIITGYPLEIPNDIPINKILTKEEDIALSCDVENVSIQRIGKDIIVFVPNKEKIVVDFKDSLTWYLTSNSLNSMKLPILIGMDYKGENFALDLSLQPHILIAGSTGSGKSITESSIIAALAMKYKKEELNFYLVDTKGVDLTLFESLPQVIKTINSIQKWYEDVELLMTEVDLRIGLFMNKKVRNLYEYNKVSNNKLPYIVLIIDELADLVERDRSLRKGVRNYPYSSVENSLQRLIQICRAAGVHIIACTQRTSVDIINGVIKANFPTRIALKVASSMDSRVILDSTGAERLLGNGDMLIKSNDSDKLNRYHSPFVKLSDIENIINHQDMIRESILNSHKLLGA